MSLTIHMLVEALESADVWDDREIDARPVPETIATLRELAWTLALRRATGGLIPSSDAPLTGNA